MDLTCKNISYSIKDKQILKNVSLNVSGNKFFTILGPNGCGKTTLLKIILENIKKMHSIKRTLPFWICLWIYAALEKRREWQNGFRKRENYVRKSNFKKILLIWRNFWKKERKICRKTPKVMYSIGEKEVQKAA